MLIRALLEKHSDLPADFADASLSANRNGRAARDASLIW